MISNRPRMPPACAALLLALIPTAPALCRQATPPPVKNRRVRLTLTVTDKPGRYVESLGKERFTLLEEKVPQEIDSFEASDEPTDIGVVFDLSRADLGPHLLESAKAALSNFVRAAGTDHRYFIIGFDGEPRLAADWLRSPEEAAAGFDKLARVRPQKKSALYDAVRAALSKLETGSRPKRALILISDGRNDGSKLKRDELFEALRKSDALVYAVGVKALGPDAYNPLALDQLNRSDPLTLNKLCSMTGGFASFVQFRAEFDNFFERLAVELKHQYTVGFTPAAAGPEGWRRLSFKVAPLKVRGLSGAKGGETVQLFVRGREGYYYAQ